MENQNREFRGVWIPKQIWLDDRLSPLDKIVLVGIYELSVDNECVANNKEIAEFCNCSASKASSVINKLINIGYIELIQFDGRTRTLRII